jgi:hypothetical protein
MDKLKDYLTTVRIKLQPLAWLASLMLYQLIDLQSQVGSSTFFSLLGMEPFTVALFKKTKYSDVDNWHVYNASKYLLIRVVCSSRLIISSREKSRVQHRP